MTQFFQFESDFVETLRCIPMQVRLKLDTCGVKLKLAQWNHFPQEDRQQLVEMPCESEPEIQAYQEFLHRLVQERTGTEAVDLPIDPHPPWLDATTIPASVLEKAEEVNTAIAPEQWAALSPLQRFALIKLSRSGHENSNFLPALKEFNLA
ncbi:MAG: nitrate reductase associated protein [Leptolyngbyaceae cyanobacterium HOT.MB2.61]|jgi:hypothetical protein|nr:nitrate reductase associated protein [Leptolyngbyaceae cyanobacterium HOT.MB2.61]